MEKESCSTIVVLAATVPLDQEGETLGQQRLRHVLVHASFDTRLNLKVKE